MSWSIGLTTNTVKINGQCARELFGVQRGEEIWYSPDEVTCEGVLNFNPDHMEWMDFLASNEDLVNVLKKHKVKGDICFGSLEGDNAGQFWGYRFDGKGGMKELTGHLVYEERRVPFADQTFVFTGTLSGMTRKEAERRVCELGGEVANSVSSKITHIIVGQNPGSKLDKAKALGSIKIWDEKHFLTVLDPCD